MALFLKTCCWKTVFTVDMTVARHAKEKQEQAGFGQDRASARWAPVLSSALAEYTGTCMKKLMIYGATGYTGRMAAQ